MQMQRSCSMNLIIVFERENFFKGRFIRKFRSFKNGVGEFKWQGFVSAFY